MLLHFSLMVLFMVDGFWLFEGLLSGLLALMFLRWFLMVFAIPAIGLLCTHWSIHLFQQIGAQAERQQVGVHFTKKKQKLNNTDRT